MIEEEEDQENQLEDDDKIEKNSSLKFNTSKKGKDLLDLIKLN